ncbi:MAG: hypothetical protein IJ026_00010 [Candidatus Methanomethylophilaceae archaeon]|nr:hypothetical protein [Candidatus Methanomethylophilaceae archaeon]
MRSGGPFQLAVYGKGGIGKSTISANISFGLASRGLDVLQVGCDPKHDSTRLLLGGEAQDTVLDLIRSRGSVGYDDIVRTGSNGVRCVEAGGPRPGIGCAGRGVLTTFETLDELHVGDDADVKVYDVLGDVVCGGFAVPMRERYADAVVIVTSEEFMSVYAANNIMRGLLNFDTGRPRLLGLVHNSRGNGDDGLVRRFSEATRVPIIATIPRSDLFRDAESRGHTLLELHPGSGPADALSAVVDTVVSLMDGGSGLRYPSPLDDGQLSDLVSGAPIRERAEVEVLEQCPGCLFDTKRVVGSCATHGAMAVLNRIKDVAVIVHGPRSCGFIMSYAQNREYFNGRNARVYPTTPFSGNVHTTNMDDSDSIFGGAAVLEAKIRELVAEGHPAVAVVTSCVTGIIGDDSKEVVRRLNAEFPQCDIMYVESDGSITGNKFGGYNQVTDALMDIVDADVEPVPGTVNLVCDTFKKSNRPDYRNRIHDALGVFSLGINASMVDVCRSEDIRNIKRGMFNIRLYDNEETNHITESLASRFGMRTLENLFPTGTAETVRWLDEVAGILDLGAEAEAAKVRMADERESALATYGHHFAGRRAVVCCRDPTNLDWMCELMGELGVDVTVAYLDPVLVTEERVHHQSEREVVLNSSMKVVRETCGRERPDFVISDYRITDLPVPCILVDKSKLNVFRYANSIRMLWLQMMAPPTAGWTEVDA